MIGEIAALGAAISWAVAPILYRKALQDTKPLTANIVRCAANAAVMVVVLVAFGLVDVLLALPSEVIGLTIVSGIIGLGIGDTLYMVGLKSVGVSRAVPLAATYPLFSFLWSVLLLGQAVSYAALGGAGAILVGIWLLTRQKNEATSASTRRAVLIGIIASLATAIVWSFSITLMDAAVMAANVTSIQANYAIITVRITAMALLLLFIAPFTDKERRFLKLNRRTILLLCIGGLVANGLGWLLMNYSFMHIMASQAIPISSTTPLFAAMAGFLFFKEKATAKTIIGGIAVVTGVVLIFLM
jgi:drug/metabolite transporter (DMT)-like permease